MKILQINNCHFRRGGADVVYLNTGNLLEKKGHNVTYFSQNDLRNVYNISSKYFINQIDYFSLPFYLRILQIPRFIYSFEAKKKLHKLISIENPDIAHIHVYKGTLTPSILGTLKKYKIPIIITLHDWGLLCPHNSFIDGKGFLCERCSHTNNPLHCILNKCNKNSLVYSIISTFEFVFHITLFPFHKYFNMLIAVSNFSQRIHQKKNKFKNKITHLYNFFPAIANRQQTFIKGNYFLYFGRLSMEKGILTLIKAWERILLMEDFSLKIAGEGPFMAELKSYAKSNNLKNIEFLGFIEGQKLTEMINNAFFVVVPSECYENNPLSIVEAYSLGKPVIGSNVGSIPEILIENKTGFLFEMANQVKLSQVMELAMKLPSEKYIELSRFAQEFAINNFSEDNHYNHLIDIYAKTINRYNENLELN